MSGGGREAFTNNREWSGTLSDVQERSGDPSGSPGVVGRSSWMSGSSREALLEVREWSGDPQECPGVVRNLSRMSKSGREVLQEVRKLSGGLPGCP